MSEVRQQFATEQLQWSADVVAASAMAVKGADWRYYKRSSRQLVLLQTLMQDAHGDLIR